ncbi:hypothetical protein HFX_6072 (plasmid) [Haloferax mediterranei ATCC 33500]|uniref:Uncharacterized protein n=1 Tax=Haloferax mediterranei (strain ATCC 33500 / DSM 1411 / JCM 8866 / NBRC 14739 / NCIMB 2177 / R-4) TaxID=523841 RepID=I3RAD9_HALMT|nr:hypothetical protein HFX_6072 [Haloferax mediterranei ATCC 33500]
MLLTVVPSACFSAREGAQHREALMEQSQANCSINEFRYDHEADATTIVREDCTDHC